MKFKAMYAKLMGRVGESFFEEEENFQHFLKTAPVPELVAAYEEYMIASHASGGVRSGLFPRSGTSPGSLAESRDSYARAIHIKCRLAKLGHDVNSF